MALKFLLFLYNGQSCKDHRRRCILAQFIKTFNLLQRFQNFEYEYGGFLFSTKPVGLVCELSLHWYMRSGISIISRVRLREFKPRDEILKTYIYDSLFMKHALSKAPPRAGNGW